MRTRTAFGFLTLATLAPLTTLLALAACSSVPSEFEPVAEDGMFDVVLLPESWVEFEGERMPDDEFLLRMRLRLRAAGWDVESKPGLRVTAREELRRDRVVAFSNRVIEDLGRWGLPGLEFAQGEE